MSTADLLPPFATSPPTADMFAFPPTRYQGSKRKQAAAIVGHLRDLDYTTVLDAFGGTGAVAHAFKQAGKHVTYNDVLAFNHQIGIALIENDATRLTDAEIEAIGVCRSGVSYTDFIERTFAGIYFADDENRWLDVAVANIRRIENRHKRAVAWFAICQAAMAKRPYNLFHRGNLYMRTAVVARSFGNKVTWDRPFADHFRRAALEANGALINGGGTCTTVCGDAMTVNGQFDLVYIDTPYINCRGVGVDYHHFYHFLEGMVRYDQWPALVDFGYKHRPLTRAPQPWNDAGQCAVAFQDLFERFRHSVLAVSYRDDGIPSIDDLIAMLRRVKARVRVHRGPARPYTLSTKRNTQEVLLIGCD